MKYFKIILFVLLFLISLKANAADIVYPIQEMSKVSCRFQKFSTLWSECKMSLPILNTKDYEKYKNDYDLYRRVYTVLWAWSYNYGWDVWNWWHQWVDIATAEWTPVYSITEWKVIVASFLTWRGNTVKIEHTINWKKIYSNYSHMSKISVSVWDKVSTKTKIWEVWTTWNSTWNHLHFQIDLISASWPWYWKKCSVKDYNTIINSSTCFSELNTNTIDPLLFLETNWAIIKSETIIEKPKQEIISQVWLLSRAEILKREIDEFLKYYNLSVDIVNFWKNIELWKSWTLRVKVTKKWSWKPFYWSFPWSMTFKYDENKMTLYPSWILQIDNWIRDVKITPKIAGKNSIEIYIWESFVKKVSFWVINTKKEITPKSTTFAVTSSNVLSENKKWVLYFKDNYWLSILWFPFSWEYRLKSNNNNIRFCIKRASSLSALSKTFNSNCEEKDFSLEQSFSYKDTTQWILIFEYKVLSEWSLLINVVDWKNNLIWTKNIKWILPKWLDKKYSYYDEIISTSRLWIPSWLNKWYFLQDRNLSESDAVNFLMNTLRILQKKCWTESCKSNISTTMYNLSKISVSKTKYLTRYEFIEYIWKYLPLEDYKKDDFIKFRDLDENKNSLVKNILWSSTWRDKFWETRYFQPTKKITRGEAIYLIYNILN